jgi:hypothetical protein
MTLDLEYIKTLIKKATPEHDAPMVVDWIPHVKRLVARVEELEKEKEEMEWTC